MRSGKKINRELFMKRVIALFCLLSMLLVMVGCPASGPSDDGKKDDGNPGDTTWIDGLGDKKFADGTEVVISCFDLYGYEIYGDENSEEMIDHETYLRNQRLEDRFNLTIVPNVTKSTGTTDLDSHYNYVRKAMDRGDNTEFDLIAMMAYQSGKQIKLGYYLDWRSEVPYVRDSIKAGKAWWPKDINTDCTVMGRQYVAVSDLCLTSMEMCYAVVFHKDLVDDNNIATKMASAIGNTSYRTMYDIVNGGDWTIDNFMGILKDSWQDNPTTGDRQKVDKEDIFGLAGGKGTDSDAWAFAFGFHYIENDGENYPEVWTVTSKTVTAISKLKEMYGYNGTYGSTWGDNYPERNQFFAEGHAYFALMSLEQLKSDVIHEMESAYGILPYPKYDKTQAKYYTGTMDHYTVLSIPYFNIQKLEETGTLVEAMSAESSRTIKDKYYSLIITHKGTREEESIPMIEMIMAGRRYDLSTYHYSDVTLPSLAGSTNASLGLFFRYMVNDDQNRDAATFWSQCADAVNASFRDLVEEYESIAAGSGT